MLLLVGATPALLQAQEVASLAGVVTDKSGAVVPDVAVQLVDTKTNNNYEAKTNSVGAYTFTKVLPGPGYKVVFTKDGFETLTVSNVYLGVDTTHTQNAELEIGKTSVTVDVNGSGSEVSLDTTDTTISTTLNMNMVHELPLSIRDNPLGLLVYSPGVTSDASGDDNTLGSRDGAVTGARADQGNYTLDGLDTNDFGTGEAFAMDAEAPIDSIQEMRSETANPLSAEGRGSGAEVQMITKSGTNKWHGSAYEYNRTSATTANDFFNVQNNIAKPPLTRNQFGASLGGPVKRDKLFFFFNYEGRRDARADVIDTIVPLDSFRAGNVNYINNSAGCNFHSRINTTPNCISTVPASNTSFDPAGIGPDQALLAFINSRYPHANDLTGGDGINTGTFRWNAPALRSGNDYVSRIDYNLSSKMKLFGRVSIFRSTYGDDVNQYTSVAPAAELFPGDPVSKEVVDHSWAFVIGHTWTITNNIVNQFNFGETRTILNFPTLFNPTGTTQYTNMMNSSTNSGQITSPFVDGTTQHRVVPIPVFKDDFTYVRGNHNIQIGGAFKPIKDSSTLVNDYNNVAIGLGGTVTSLNPSDDPTQNQVPNDILGRIPGDLTDSAISGTALRTWSQAYAFSLGRIGNIDSLYNNAHNLEPLPQGTGHARTWRYYETELYAQDTFRVRSDLTLTYGLRWSYYSVPYEINGFETAPNIDFASMYNARAAAGQAGISGDGVVPTVVYNFAGKGNHARGLYNPDYRDFAPRLSFAYNPSVTSGFLGRIFGDRKTVIRGGAGLVNDHTILSAINFFNDQDSFVFGQDVGTLSTAGLANDPRFTALGALPPLTPPQPSSVPFTPYLAAGTTNQFTGLNSNLGELAVDPHYKTPYSETFTFGFQRELPGNFMLESSYFLRMGHRLLSRSDAGQVADFVDPASKQKLVQQFTNLSVQARNGQPITQSNFFENQMTPAVMANYGTDCPGLAAAIGSTATNCTQLVNDPQIAGALVPLGDMADTLQALYLFGLMPANVGLDPQFSSQLYFGNKSYSSYNGLLSSLHKKMSRGLQFDVNYTYSHSIDNSSTIANNATGSSATGGYGGFLCDAIQLGSCRGNSDFDITHLVSADALYALPFGKGRTFASNAPRWLDEIIGGWEVAALESWHTGFAFTTVSEAFPVSFNANSPALFIGKPSDIRTKVHTDPATGQIQLFADPTAALNAFTGPLGLQSPTRNNLRGPRYSNTNLSLNKHFAITESAGLEFRAEAYNAFNHVNYSLPTGSVADIAQPSTFGVITRDYGPRVMQFSLRLDF
jgi:Carboxypeptidase regulatory-like domain